MAVAIISILIVSLVFAIAKGFLKGKAGLTKERYDTAMTRAEKTIQSGTTLHPSWISDEVFQKQFAVEIKNAAIDAGLSSDKALSFLRQPPVANAVMTAAACFEQEGFNRFEQVTGACDFTKIIVGRGAGDIVFPSEAKMAEQQVANAELVEIPVAVSTDVLEPSPAGFSTTSEVGTTAPLAEQAVEQWEAAHWFNVRLRHNECYHSLVNAKHLFEKCGERVPDIMLQEIEFQRGMAKNYFSGQVESMRAAFSPQTGRASAISIIKSNFKISDSAWESRQFDFRKMEHFFFQEMHDIFEIDEGRTYFSTCKVEAIYPRAFIHKKANNSTDWGGYVTIKQSIHTWLCSFEISQLHFLRSIIHEEIHNAMLDRDYGVAPDNKQPWFRDVTKEAKAFKLSSEN